MTFQLLSFELLQLIVMILKVSYRKSRNRQESTRLSPLLKVKQLLNILTYFTSDDRHKLMELSPEILPSEYTYHKRVQLISSKFLTEAYTVKDSVASIY